MRRRAETPSFPFRLVALYAFLSTLYFLFTAAPAHAAITAASLSTYSIPYETTGSTGTNIQFTLDAISSVEIDIHRLENITDAPSAANLVAAIQQNGLAAASHTIFWNALWLVGGDIGRQNGNFQIIINATSAGTTTSFTIPTLLSITSVDIHGVTVTPSADADSNPVLPYNIVYSLAKDSLVTIQVLDSTGTLVRTLKNGTPEYGESIKINNVQWDGLDANNLPVPLGIYTVRLSAKDPGSSDQAIVRTRTAAIQSLASLGASPNERFSTNAFVYPNPIRFNQANFQMLAVRNNANLSLRIYTLTGDLVREVSFADVPTGNIVTFTWDTNNQSGNPVGRGLYYFVAREEDPEGTLQTVKKLAVIR